MARNPLIPKKDNSKVKLIDLPKSAGILDDFAVRKNLATKEGTIEKVPVNDSDIVNKKYVDEHAGTISLVTDNPTAADEGELILNTSNKTIYVWHLDEWRIVFALTMDYLLLETGDFVLLETGDKIIR